ncbi:exonuclease RecJ [Lachnospiraceae bacterium KHCPX20]|nr:exonuclease RecJ [Lachnospiraceae bacterium KHCPX20]
MRYEKRTTAKTVTELVSKRLGLTQQEFKQQLKRKGSNLLKIPYLKEAVECFWSCYEQKKKIYIYTDYDCDGQTSAAIIKIGLDAIHIPIEELYVPARTDGYGLTTSFAEKVGANLLITIDNGIKAHTAIKAAKEQGATVIVLDHHLPDKKEDGAIILPQADVIVDPHVFCNLFDDYCGAGLAFRFIYEIFKTKRKPEQNLADVCMVLITLAGIGTVGDCVTMKSENRFFVKTALDVCERKGASAGVNSILDLIKASDRMTAADFGFSISPLVNAYGRLEPEGSKKTAGLLSATEENDTLLQLALECAEKNEQRKAMTEEAEELADKLILQTNQQDKSFIVLADKRFLHGLAGIIAGRVAEKYHVPTIIFSGEEGEIKGSGRSRDWCNMELLLRNINHMFPNLIKNYGGHEQACGICIDASKLEDLKVELQKLSKVEEINPDVFEYDLEGRSSVIESLCKEVRLCGPYGVGNEEPIFHFSKIRLEKRKVWPANYKKGMKPEIQAFKRMGKDNNTVKFFSSGFEMLYLSKDGGYKAYEEIGCPEELEVYGTLMINSFNGTYTPQIKVMRIEKTS